MVRRLPDFWSNWNLEMLTFVETGKPGVPREQPFGETATNSAHAWRRRRDLNPGHIGGRRVLSPLRHPFLPRFYMQLTLFISTLLVSPEIIRPPPDLAVDEGDSILMECVARGFPIPRIRWLQNNQPTRYNGSVVQIAAVKSQHTGVYRCVAENIAGNASATAVLAIRGKFV